MAFGQSAFLNLNENKTRFYNSIALSECFYLQINKKSFNEVVEAQKKKSLNAKIAFIKTIPDFNNEGLPRSKL